LDYESAEATFLPDLYIPLDADGAGKMFKLLEALEDSDEVQNVYANFDVSDEIMAQLDV
jgi:transcriptional/translational regulatory protein YebC/TACO1